jgi:aspartate racemase
VTTLGIVGGLGLESTIDYYRRILEEWKHDDPSSSPSIIIDSLDVNCGLLARSPIPLVSIVEACAEEAQRRNLRLGRDGADSTVIGASRGGYSGAGHDRLARRRDHPTAASVIIHTSLSKTAGLVRRIDN